MEQKIIFTPILTSKAGRCLTSANWQQSGTHAVSYYLDELLLKPGLDSLKSVASLKQYVAWPGHITLNASSLCLKDNNYIIRSHYDGTTMRFPEAELLPLIIQLQPDHVLLPPGIANHSVLEFPETIRPIYSVDEQQHVNPPFGVYLNDECSDHTPLEEITSSSVNYYLNSQFDSETINQLNAPRCYLESDKPAADAVRGIIYGSEGYFDLTAQDMQEQYRPLQEGCLCPSCDAPLTRAYLHHLLHHTPLLAQRFLVQHNIFYIHSLLKGL